MFLPHVNDEMMKRSCFMALSPFSNLFMTTFSIANVEYTSVEQYLQSEKVALFGNDKSQALIMKESNLYRVKRLGSKIQRFSMDHWHGISKQTMFKAVKAKFSQNNGLRGILMASCDKIIAECSGFLLGNWSSFERSECSGLSVLAQQRGRCHE